MVKYLLYSIFIIIAFDTIYAVGPVCANYTEIFDPNNVTSGSTIGPNKNLSVTSCQCLQPNTIQTMYNYNTVIVGDGAAGTLSICDGTGGTAPITDSNRGLYLRVQRFEVTGLGTLTLSAKSSITNAFNFTITQGLTTGGIAAGTPTIGAGNPTFSEQATSFRSRLNDSTLSCLPNFLSTLTNSSYINLTRPGSILNTFNTSIYCANNIHLSLIVSPRNLSSDGNTPTYQFNCSGSSYQTYNANTDITTVTGTYKYGVVAPAVSNGNTRSATGGGAVGCKGSDDGTIQGGRGGAVLYIEANDFVARSNALIESNGAAGTARTGVSGTGTDGGGGGGAGFLFIKANTINIENNANIRAVGGFSGTQRFWWNHPSMTNCFGTNLLTDRTGRFPCQGLGSTDAPADYYGAYYSDLAVARAENQRRQGGFGVDGPIIFVYGSNFTNNGTVQTSHVFKNGTTSRNAIVIKDLWSPGHALSEGSVPILSNTINLRLNDDLINNATFFYNQNSERYITYEGARRIAINNQTGATPLYWVRLENLNLNFKNKAASNLYFPINLLQVYSQPNISFGDDQSYNNVFCFPNPISTNCNTNDISVTTRDIIPNAWNTNFTSFFSVAETFYNGGYNLLFDRYYDIPGNSVFAGGLGGPFLSKFSIPMFAYRSSEGSLNLNLKVGTNGYNQNGNEFNFLNLTNAVFDQYAPCDDRDDNCNLNIRNGDKNVNKLTTNTFVLNSFSNLELHLETSIRGSNITRADTPNVKVFVAGQRGNQLIDSTGTNIPILGNITGKTVQITDANSQTALGKSCTELVALGTGNWANYSSSAIDFVYNGNTFIEPNWSSLRTRITTTLQKVAAVSGTDCVSNCDGTLYLIFCFKDNAGNWSRVIQSHNGVVVADIDKQNGVNAVDRTLITNNINNYKGIQNPRSLYPYKHSFNTCSEPSNTFLCYRDETQEAFLNLPTFIKRLFIDTPGIDYPLNPDCTEDPCPIPIISNLYAPLVTRNLERDVRIAFSPAGWTNQNSISVGIKLPEDKTGIKRIYYYVGGTAPSSVSAASVINIIGNISPTICDNVIAANSTSSRSPSINWVDYCFSIENVNDNQNVYIALEDGAGNISNFSSRSLFIDKIKPQVVSELKTNVNYIPITNPLLSFKSSVDSASLGVGVIGAGIKSYKICYWEENQKFTEENLKILNINQEGACPKPSDIGYNITNSIIFDNPVANAPYQNYQLLGLACCLKWNIAVYAIDLAGNYSLPSSILQFVNTDGKPIITFTREKYDYIVGGVSPRIGTTGLYTFKIRYTDLLDRPEEPSLPTKTEVWVDLNGDSKYDSNEKFPMNRLGGENQYGDNNYSNGEDYYFTVQLKYNKNSLGKINYRFIFQGKNNLPAQTSIAYSVDATKEYNLILDPYDPNTINGMMEVRNNLATPDSTIFPTIIIKEPPTGIDSVIRIIIYDNYHNIVRILYHAPYTNFGRYIRWNLKNDMGSLVLPGVYNIVYEYGENYEYQKVMVIR